MTVTVTETQVTEVTETQIQIVTVGIQGPPGGGGGGTDHGALTGLADDDHTQYHNDARGDARYSQLGHTHTASQITDFSTAADARIANARGANDGIAPLDSGGKVPAINLPAYVDDVLEYANLAAFPGTGTASIIYVALDTNKTYRWSGSAYVEISPSPGSTDSVTEGSTNLYFTAARAIASLLTGFTAGAGTVSASDSILQAIQKIVGNIAALVTGVSSVNGNTGAVTITNIAGESGTVTSINGKISAGTNVTLTGTGTNASPYVINSSGGGGGVDEAFVIAMAAAL